MHNRITNPVAAAKATPAPRRPVAVTLSAKFVAYAERSHLSPEMLAQFWCDELARRSRDVLNIITNRPLEVDEALAIKRQRLLAKDGKEGV